MLAKISRFTVVLPVPCSAQFIHCCIAFSEDPPTDVLRSPKRFRVAFTSLGRYAADFLKIKFRKFDDTYHIVDKAKEIKNYLSATPPGALESHQPTGDMSASPDMFASKTHSQSKVGQIIHRQPTIS
jgi:hypothetical protein